ncbi:MAG: T9SS type A sorting domain-containing protein [Bacteroidia bacterium]|nr:T9SS type A sorting domain-containing protein [Bacteroidia bacterium]
MKKIFTTIAFVPIAIGTVFICSQQVIAQCASPNSVSNANLVLDIPFKNGMGTDVSGNNFNVALVGSSSSPGVQGVPSQSVSFVGSGGSGGSITSDPLMDVSNQMTVACWFNSANIATSQRIIDKLNGLSGNFMVDINAGKPRFFVGSQILAPNYPLFSNNWYFIACTYDGSVAKIYINGTVVSSLGMTANLVANTNPIRIAYSQSGTVNLNGKMEDLKFYTRSLSATEITQLFEAPHFSAQPQNVSLCTSVVHLSANAYSGGSASTFKWKKGATYLSDNVVYSGTATSTLTITNGTATELGQYEVEAYSPACLMEVSDTGNVVAGSLTSFNNTGLILNYPFNNLSGADVSGNNLNTTINAATSLPNFDQNSAQNLALNLNGSLAGSGAVTPHNNLMNVSNQITLSCWFRANSVSANQRLMDKLTGTTTGNFLVDIIGGTLRFYCGTANITTSPVLVFNTWYHVTCTYDGTDMKLYLNGVLLNTLPYTGTMTSNTSDFIVGMNQVGGNRLAGDINDVRFYSRALSQSEITILQTLPEVAVEPQDTIACLNETAKLICSGSDASAFMQWKKNGVPMTDVGNISGAYNDTLTISNVGLTDYDVYSCDFINSNCLMISSTQATLSQATNTSISNNNLVMYFPFSNASTSDLSGNNLNMGTVLGVTGTNDKDNNFNQALSFNGTSSQCNVVSNPLMYSNGNQLTISVWINPTTNNDQRIVEKNGSYYLDIYTGTIRFILNGGTTLLSSYFPTVGIWQHIVATYDGTAMKVYADGLLVSTNAVPGVNITVNTNQFLFGIAQGGTPYRFGGAMDEFRFYKRALTAQEVLALYNSASLVAQPASSLVCPYGSAGLSASVLSTGNTFYQWMYNGTPLSGETNSTLALSGITAANAGAYTCSYTSHCTSFTTDTAFITIQSVDASTVLSGGNMLVANNAPVTTFQWVDCNNAFAPIPSETNNTFSPVATGDYAVIVTTNSCPDTSVCTNVMITSIKNEAELKGVIVFPNPATNFVTVQLPSVSESTFVSIYDVTGKIVRAVNLTNPQTQIDIKELNSGIYLLRITNETGGFTKRFVKE